MSESLFSSELLFRKRYRENDNVFFDDLIASSLGSASKAPETTKLASRGPQAAVFGAGAEWEALCLLSTGAQADSPRAKLRPTSPSCCLIPGCSWPGRRGGGEAEVVITVKPPAWRHYLNSTCRSSNCACPGRGGELQERGGGQGRGGKAEGRGGGGAKPARGEGPARPPASFTALALTDARWRTVRN